MGHVVGVNQTAINFVRVGDGARTRVSSQSAVGFAVGDAGTSSIMSIYHATVSLGLCGGLIRVVGADFICPSVSAAIGVSGGVA